MKKPTTKIKVHIVIKSLNSLVEADGNIVKVFKGTRKKAATKWAQEQQAASIPSYRRCSEPTFSVETWEVD